MRALVTGATGFIGGHLVRLLLAKADHVAILARSESARGRLADVGDRLKVIEIASGRVTEARATVVAFSPDAVFHLAWSGVHGRDRDDPRHVETNVRFTLDLLDVAAASGCATFVGLGSQAEYGPHDGVIDESTPFRPISSYGVAKLAVGLLIDNICRAAGMRGVWLRLLSAYGPGDQPDYLIPYLIRELLAGRVPHLSSGEQPHDTLYCEDVAAALRAAALSPRCRGQYVLASAIPITVREIAETLRGLAAPEAQLEYGTAAGHPGWRGSHAHLTADTGWSPSVNLRIGLERTVLWCREHADREPASSRDSRAGASRR
jgi:UDP-glucose 4-epimerase